MSNTTPPPFAPGSLVIADGRPAAVIGFAAGSGADYDPNWRSVEFPDGKIVMLHVDGLERRTVHHPAALLADVLAKAERNLMTALEFADHSLFTSDERASVRRALDAVHGAIGTTTPARNR